MTGKTLSTSVSFTSLVLLTLQKSYQCYHDAHYTSEEVEVMLKVTWLAFGNKICLPQAKVPVDEAKTQNEVFGFFFIFLLEIQSFSQYIEPGVNRQLNLERGLQNQTDLGLNLSSITY